MPGFTTHFLFGQNAYEVMDYSPLKESIYAHEGAFNLGLQGPDPFFYFLPATILYGYNIGSVAHGEKSGIFLENLLKSLELFSEREDRETAEAYIAGSIGHYTLDCKCHPYVFFRSHYGTKYKEKTSEYSSRHILLETDMDHELLYYFWGMIPSSFSQSATLRMTKKEVGVVAQVMHYAYSQTYPERKPSELLMHLGIRSMQLGTRLLRDPLGKKKVIVRKIEGKTLGYPLLSSMIASDKIQFYTDPLNLAGRMWRNPWKKEEVSKASVPDLLAEAQEEYLHRLELLDEGDCAALLENLGNRSYLSGLPEREADSPQP